LGEVLGRVTMQVFVRDPYAMIAAPVQCDVDGIPKGSHCVSVPPDGEASETMPFTPVVSSNDSLGGAAAWLAESFTGKVSKTLLLTSRLLLARTAVGSARRAGADKPSAGRDDAQNG
jgi:hypothetical protein